jgi:signal transduction histidine kinase
VAAHPRTVAAQRALTEAKGQAEAASQSKTRFLAAVSHDLMQPNAARLFSAALSHQDDGLSTKPSNWCSTWTVRCARPKT